jgi:glucose-1-phosphate cytidylyltransferase
MKTIILAGGLGTRLQEETTVKPKPMVEIGGQPMLWHIMKIYAMYGHKDFAIAMGYKSEVIRSYFLNYYYHHCNMTVNLGTGEIEIEDGDHDDWKVYLADTGDKTQTGGRIKRLAHWIGNKTFMFTYGDGVSDINIDELIKFHKKNGKLATVTAIRPPFRFGSIVTDGDFVQKFLEKPMGGESWASGGFFVLEPGVLDYISGDEMPWEWKPLEQLTNEGQLVAYRHEGFWQCMDTIRDVQYLEGLWAEGKAPWKIW